MAFSRAGPERISSYSKDLKLNLQSVLRQSEFAEAILAAVYVASVVYASAAVLDAERTPSGVKKTARGRGESI
jgi:hypothetical protein